MPWHAMIMLPVPSWPGLYSWLTPAHQPVSQTWPSLPSQKGCLRQAGVVQAGVGNCGLGTLERQEKPSHVWGEREGREKRRKGREEEEEEKRKEERKPFMGGHEQASIMAWQISGMLLVK